nr:MAG TPA_asm: hypothetical protein [Bacteriophage sp.]
MKKVYKRLLQQLLPIAINHYCKQLFFTCCLYRKVYVSLCFLRQKAFLTFSQIQLNFNL